LLKIGSGNLGVHQIHRCCHDPNKIERRFLWQFRVLAVLATMCLCGPSFAEPSHTPASAIRTISHRNFIVHTDMSSEETKTLVDRMNATLHKAAKYWGRRLRGRIECYVVRDLDHWAPQDFPDHDAVYILRNIGGRTQSVASTRGDSHRKRARIYANADMEVAEHEVIHAYCVQTFGTTGPCWYREGMAQFGSYVRDEADDAFPKQVTNYLQGNARLSVEQIVQRRDFTAGLGDPAQRVSAGAKHGQVAEQLDQDTTSENLDLENRDAIQHHYWESWALCYFLDHHPDYQQRFHLLGDCYMRKQCGTFAEIFAPVADILTRDFQDFVAKL